MNKEQIQEVLNLIEQYTRIDFYGWLMNDPAGLQSDPTKKAIEAKAILDAALKEVEG